MTRQFKNGYGKGLTLDRESAYTLLHNVHDYLWNQIFDAKKTIRDYLGDEKDCTVLERPVDIRHVKHYNALVESKKSVYELIDAEDKEAR